METDFVNPETLGQTLGTIFFYQRMEAQGNRILSWEQTFNKGTDFVNP